MIQTKEEARESLLKGLNILADLVKTTLGPHGSTVILHTFEGKAYTTKDGVSVARQVFDNDMMVDAGIQLVREATSKTAEVAGDGTTTSTILTQALITRCIQSIKEGESPLILKQQMDLALKDIIELLKKSEFSTKVGFDKKSLKDIATISANNDSQLGELIADAFIEAGEDGLVLFDMSSGENTTVETLNGMQIESQLLSPAFINNQRSQTAEYEERDHPVAVLLIDNIVKNVKDMAQSTLNYAISKQIPILLVAHDFTPAVLKEIIQNNVRNNTQILPIKADGFGIGKTECLKDISAITGAVIYDNTEVTSHKGYGICNKVIVSKFNTTIIKSDKINLDKFNERVDVLKSRIKEESDSFNRKKLQEKLAKLIGKMAVIHVGGITESIAKEKYDRVEDAVYATKAAIEEGVSIGGGMTYANIGQRLYRNEVKDRPGVHIVLGSLLEPFHQLSINSSVKDISPFDCPKEHTGYDFRNYRWVDMIEEGIIDPTKVLRVALENAVSVAGMIITTSGIITKE